MQLVIPPSIPPGDYTLVASKFVWIHRVQRSYGPYGMLVSNPIRIEVKPATTEEPGKR